MSGKTVRISGKNYDISGKMFLYFRTNYDTTGKCFVCPEKFLYVRKKFSPTFFGGKY